MSGGNVVLSLIDDTTSLCELVKIHEGIVTNMSHFPHDANISCGYRISRWGAGRPPLRRGAFQLKCKNLVPLEKGGTYWRSPPASANEYHHIAVCVQ